MANEATQRDDQVQAEAAALWRALFGEPPPIQADGVTMLDVIMKSLPEVAYDRLASPHLRPAQIARPRNGLQAP
ncbi:hypothetical protein [Phenylobacterium sp. J367]|uniref:hypothetical protein n=1 Tax=Phenylobacterium sp. J367 TaxID=2898435 RepID=UPI0021512C64|nr:hypothetical protein [Phenylobacterium sp. J367]MCR5878222.1 hypothetical protein [Phenylobacterium sp. J367]